MMFGGPSHRSISTFGPRSALKEIRRGTQLNDDSIDTELLSIANVVIRTVRRVAPQTVIPQIGSTSQCNEQGRRRSYGQKCDGFRRTQHAASCRSYELRRELATRDRRTKSQPEKAAADSWLTVTRKAVEALDQ